MTKRIGAAYLVLAALCALASMGCFVRSSSSRSGSSGSSEDEFRGTLEVRNESGQAVCGFEVHQSDQHSAVHEGRLEPGASANVEIVEAIQYLFANDCGGNGFVYADTVSEEGGAIAIRNEPQTFQERFDYLRRLNRMNTNPVMQDSSLQARMHEQTLARARDQQWIDTPSVTVIASDAWSNLNHRYSGMLMGRRIAGMVGHVFPNGMCTIQVHTYTEEAVNGSLTGQIRYEGTAGNIGAGCKMIEWMGGNAGSASSAASGGGGESGGCTNTCRSANDGECDDGGPGAQYNVCALGTDCADCGTRSGGGASSGGAASSGGSCTNTCRSANDGECDDGGPGAQYGVCALGTDCADCGAR